MQVVQVGEKRSLFPGDEQARKVQKTEKDSEIHEQLYDDDATDPANLNFVHGLIDTITFDNEKNHQNINDNNYNMENEWQYFNDNAIVNNNDVGYHNYDNEYLNNDNGYHNNDNRYHNTNDNDNNHQHTIDNGATERQNANDNTIAIDNVYQNTNAYNQQHITNNEIVNEIKKTLLQLIIRSKSIKSTKFDVADNLQLVNESTFQLVQRAIGKMREVSLDVRNSGVKKVIIKLHGGSFAISKQNINQGRKKKLWGNSLEFDNVHQILFYLHPIANADKLPNRLEIQLLDDEQFIDETITLGNLVVGNHKIESSEATKALKEEKKNTEICYSSYAEVYKLSFINQ